MNKRKITVEEAARIIGDGGMVIVTDHEDRENEGDLVGAARFATDKMIAFMASRGRGLICCSLEEEICQRAGLGLLNDKAGSEAIHGTRFCMPVDLIEGCTTGISAADRAATISRFCEAGCSPGDFARPGHMFPIMEASGGLAAREGHTEASLYLTRLAGLEGAAVICEMMEESGEMVRGDAVYERAGEWGLGVLSVQDLVEHLHNHSQSESGGEASLSLPVKAGDFRFELLDSEDGREHFSLFRDEAEKGAEHPEGPLVRIHSECLTGDLLGSRRCDCGEQMDRARSLISRESQGFLIYLRQEGRGIGLKAKLEAYRLQDEGLDTLDANLHLGHPADGRDYSMAAEYLLKKGIRRIRLLTNNPDKIKQLEEAGMNVIRVPLLTEPVKENARYMRTKQERMGHLSA